MGGEGRRLLWKRPGKPPGSDTAGVVRLLKAADKRLPLCQAYLISLPVYQALLPGEDFSSASAFARAREYLIRFVVAGMMVDPGEMKSRD